MLSCGRSRTTMELAKGVTRTNKHKINSNLSSLDPQSNSPTHQENIAVSKLLELSNTCIKASMSPTASHMKEELDFGKPLKYPLIVAAFILSICYIKCLFSILITIF